ncbi:MAG: group 1 truncated hemoglobin [Pseudomonadales bacterium]|nr:group 1 truncated hemoglobin [Pseudomonadales bacterium]
MSESLYKRLGGTPGINAIANDLVDNHLSNPTISTRFTNADPEKLKKGAATFFITGTGGAACYEGKDMTSVHKNMNISAVEYMAALDDALDALDNNNVGQREKEEVLFILHSFRKEIMHV